MKGELNGDRNYPKQSYYKIEQPLILAMELSNTEWRLGFTIGLGQPPRLRKLKAQDLAGLMKEIDLSKKRFGLPRDARGAELL